MQFKELYETIITEIDERVDQALINKIKSYINRGYRELAKREVLEKTLTVNSKGKFFKPDDLIKVLNVVDLEGNPVKYGYEGMYIRTDYTGKLKLIYNYMPDNLVNDKDVPETNIANEDFIINYAKYLYNLVEEQDETAKLHKIEYEGMTLIKNNYRLTKTINVYSGGDEVV